MPELQPVSPFCPASLDDGVRSFLKAARYRLRMRHVDAAELNSYPQDVLSCGYRSGRYEFLVTTRNTFADEESFRSSSVGSSALPAEVLKYLSPSLKIESDHPEIAALSAKLLSRIRGTSEPSLFEHISAVLNFLVGHLSYDEKLASRISRGESDTESAVTVLHSGLGTCSEFTNLFLAVLRQQGVPARFVSGISFPSGAHAWAEVFVSGPRGRWLPVDPLLNSEANLKPESRTGSIRLGVWATHIKLFGAVDFPAIGLKLREWGIERVELLEHWKPLQADLSKMALGS